MTEDSYVEHFTAQGLKIKHTFGDVKKYRGIDIQFCEDSANKRYVYGALMPNKDVLTDPSFDMICTRIDTWFDPNCWDGVE